MKAKILPVTLLAVLALSACGTKVAGPLPPKSDALIIGNPFDYGMDNILIFPVGGNYKPRVYEETGIKVENSMGFKVNNIRSELYDSNAETEYINTNEDKFDIRNILFYDMKTGKTYPLMMDTLHILSFAMHKEFSKPLIFYRVVKNDYNGDSIYNSKDPVMLFVSDLYGKNLTQVTPASEQFINYTYYPLTQTILTKTVIDANGDKHFTISDETNFREMKIKEPAMGREIFNKSLKDSLRTQIKAV